MIIKVQNGNTVASVQSMEQADRVGVGMEQANRVGVKNGDTVASVQSMVTSVHKEIKE